MNSWGNALELLGATAIASALGSLHCVGMCGPFAIMASLGKAVADPDQKSSSGKFDSKLDVLQRMTAYHFGRLATYVSIGLVVGFLASSLGRWDWFRSVGFWAGVVLISLGAVRLFNALSPGGLFNDTIQHGRWVHDWSVQLARLRHRLPRSTRWQIAFGWGLTTTLLPCGWLYVFVITAAAAPSTSMAVATMFAFWLGTLPLLSISVWGWRLVGDRWRGATGVVSSLCILTMGIYLMIARTTVDLPVPPALLNRVSAGERIETEQLTSQSLEKLELETGWERLNRLRAILNEGLPCCQSDKEEGGL